MSRKVLLISEHNLSQFHWTGITYDICNVVSSVEKATCCAPSSAQYFFTPSSLWSLFCSSNYKPKRFLSNINSLFQKKYIAERCVINEDHDLCMVFVFRPRDLRFIDRVEGWRKHSKIACLFILELYSGEVEEDPDLARLQEFDHVFLVTEETIPLVRKRTATPITQLSLGVDALRAASGLDDANLARRPIDILCFGRREPTVHEHLIEIAERRGWLYVYDAWQRMQTSDWETARKALAEMTRRSRYSVVWGPTIAISPYKTNILRGDRPMSGRFFEATAGGSVMIGDYDTSPVIDRLLDWPDSMVRIRRDGSDLEAVLDALEANPARVDRIRRANIVNCLRRHDWSHRWFEVLRTLGLEPTGALVARQEALEGLAVALEAGSR